MIHVTYSDFIRPLHGLTINIAGIPPLKRWAIFIRPLRGLISQCLAD
jgi:hypothetical protein